MKIIRDPGAIVAALLQTNPILRRYIKLYQEPIAKKKVDLLIVLVFILESQHF